MTLDSRAKRLLDLLAASAGGSPEPQTAEQRRTGLRGLAELAAGRESFDVEAHDLCIAGGGGSVLTLRAYRPDDQASGPGGLIVYVHGGGWVGGDLETHDGVCRAIAGASQCAVLAVAYRRPPEHPFPAAVEDALASLAWAADHATTLGARPDRLGLAGDSAGGNIVAAACLAARTRGGPAVAVQALICPILEIIPSQPSRQEYREGFFLDSIRFMQDASDYTPPGMAYDDPQLSPLRASDLEGLPTTLIHVAEHDPFRDEGLAYADRLRQHGTPVVSRVHTGMIHYFYALPKMIPYANTALAQLGADIRSAFETA